MSDDKVWPYPPLADDDPLVQALRSGQLEWVGGEETNGPRIRSTEDGRRLIYPIRLDFREPDPSLDVPTAETKTLLGEAQREWLRANYPDLTAESDDD